MDRERQDELPKLQLEWIDGICFPLYKVDIGFNDMLLQKSVTISKFVIKLGIDS